MNDPRHDKPESPPSRIEATSPSDADEFVQILDEYLAALKAGNAQARQELLARYPAIASQLEVYLAGVDFIHNVEADPKSGRSLGDFRIIREVGCGGMGAVFEAEQVSLGRRVALKVLRFGGTSDQEAIERFRREAETIAKLHHTNIVPIFAVGSEHGVNYYAMQFIDGHSLADLLVRQPGPIDAHQVAEWGLQAAEALAHAHQRGVVHRDVKPSNLLVDLEGRIWLTDFGLARRTDDVTLSLTGVLLGTPRYMSPEQATASTKRVDHRSDLFSLGATLYELLAGKPAFSGNSAHEVIQQIISSEPAPIRRINPNAPRDLETIVMKCLAKEPTARYANAAELAADLRAYLDNRPIRARRAGQLERGLRWLKKHRRSIRQVGLAAAVTLMLTLGATLASSSYERWNRSSIRLDAADPPLVAEFLDSDGETARVETLPMQNAAPLRAGDYQLRVSRAGMLSQTYDLKLEQGHENAQYTVDLGDNLLLPPTNINRVYDIATLGDRRGIIEWTAEGMALHVAGSPLNQWTFPFAKERPAGIHDYPGFAWPWLPLSVSENSGYGSYRHQPWVVQQPFDINGDGTGDIVIAARHQAWMMAISGTGNDVLWFAPRSEQLSKARPNDGGFYDRTIRGAVLEEPLVANDLDQDGKPDLIVLFLEVAADVLPQQNRYPSRRWLEAVSSATGKTIWQYDLADELFGLPGGQDAPYAMRWFPDVEGGRTGSGAPSMHFGRHPIRGRGKIERTSSYVYRPDTPRLVSVSGQSRLAVVAGSKLVLIDPADGKTVEVPISLPAMPSRAAIWADLDGDTAIDLVVVEEVAGSIGSPALTPMVRAWSLARRKGLWSKQLDSAWPSPIVWSAEPPHWPLVADLNADGRSEVIVPLERSGLSQAFAGGGWAASRETPWCALGCISGESGEVLWKRRLVSMDMQIDQFIDGPDIDGDGSREVFAAAMAGPGVTLYVDAISGKTGEVVWSSPHQVSGDTVGFREPYPVELKWWNGGEDALPQLLVRTVQESGGNRESSWFAFSSGDGRLAHVGEDITELQPADVDGDGADDLIIYSSKTPFHRDQGGSLHVLRGIGGTAWQRLGELGEPVADLDGDRVDDLVRSWGDGTLIATSGAMGRELWRNRPLPAVDQFVVRSADASSPTTAGRSKSPTEQLHGDLNGDGVVDLLAHDRSTGGRGRVAPLHAISGRTGQRLWSIGDVTVQMIGGTLALQAVDLDQDGNQEVVWLAAVDYQYPIGTVLTVQNVQLWLFVADGRTGELNWSRSLSPAYGQTAGNFPPYPFHAVEFSIEIADLDQDGTLDLLTPGIDDSDELELVATSGSAGKALWHRKRLTQKGSQIELSDLTAPSVCQLQEGEPDVILVEPKTPMESAPDGSQTRAVVLALRPTDGQPRWSHQTGVHYHPSIDKKGKLLRPLELRTASNQRLAAVLLPGTAGSKIVIYGRDGKVAEHEIQLSGHPSELAKIDVDHDGLDELAFFDREVLHIARPTDLSTPVWSKDFKSTGHFRLIDVLTSPQSDREIIAVASDPTHNTVLGLDAGSGQIRWTCPGPIPRAEGTYEMLNQLAILGSSDGAAPLVFMAHGFVSECRRAAPAGAMHENALSVMPLETAGLNQLRETEDSRWKRDLPWRLDATGNLGRFAEFVGWSVFFSVALLLLPAGYLAWLVHRRRFSLVSLMLLPLVAAIFLTAAMVRAPADNDFNTVATRIAIGATVAPTILSLALLGWWFANGRWRRALFWLAAVVVLAAVMGGVLLATYIRHHPLLPEESFDWTGWHHVFLPAVYTTACLALSATALEWLGKLLLKKWKGRKTLSLPTPSADDSTVAIVGTSGEYAAKR